MPLSAGTRLGPYEILGPLGRGGMAEVYRARDTRLDRTVAVKVLLPDFAADPGRLRRFEQEARAVGSLNHANILTLYDVGTHDGSPYLVSEFVEGASLRTLLAGGPLPLREVLDYSQEIALGLAAAHERGIIHRDLKPENIMITRAGCPKILDFGLAKLAPDPATSETPTQTGITRPGSVMGTLGYMSPEQVRGETVDHRADIFALGAVLYEMLSGRPAFRRGTPAETVAAILGADPAELPATSERAPPILAQVVKRCLEKKPEDRFQSARDVAFALETASGPSLATRSLESHRRLRRLAVLGIAATAIVLGVTAHYWRTRRPPVRSTQALPLKNPTPEGDPESLSRSTPRHIQSLSVLPFQNLSEDPNQDYFVDGMTDELITNLAQISSLRVISRTSTMQYRSTKKSLAQIARELRVDGIVEGSVVRSADKVRITAQLIDAATDRNLWAQSYERDLKDVLTLQREVADAIVREIKVTLTPQEHALLTSSRRFNTDAYEAYLRGRYFWNKWTEDGVRKSISYFEQAIQLDPRYALAYAGLADSYNALGDLGMGVIPSGAASAESEAAALKAIALDETLGEAYAALAMARFRCDRDWIAVEKEFKRAIELNSGYATAHHWYSHYLMAAGRGEESLAESRRAYALNPIDVEMGVHLQWYYYYVHDYDQAIKEGLKALEIDSNFSEAHWLLGLAYEQKGLYLEADRELRKAVDLSGHRTLMLSSLGHLYGVSGKESAALTSLRDLQDLSKRSYVPAYNLAILYVGLGDKAAALSALERAYQEPSYWLFTLKTDPRLDPLRPDRRFAALIGRVGFPN
jgi:serine/threonine protein kinase/tetratricopeptide (TPR) repeat protein